MTEMILYGILIGVILIGSIIYPIVLSKIWDKGIRRKNDKKRNIR